MKMLTDRHAYRMDIPVYRDERESLFEVSTSKATDRALREGEIQADSANALIC